MELFYGNKGESQGNQIFADFLLHLIRVIENAGMLIIDEFGNSLHNKLAEKLLNSLWRMLLYAKMVSCYHYFS